VLCEALSRIDGYKEDERDSSEQHDIGRYVGRLVGW